ncbi:MAG: Asp-tRNA(Asn)/Glu-tRNA(Gln) amidotransferase subunit GatA [Acidobacteria bacterium]|nr:Asp-tRNA(Asn)/Glu-tRNA(Gln) amidotransferase subunit GatA [Acidobacteriota bacterium]
MAVEALAAAVRSGERTAVDTVAQAFTRIEEVDASVGAFLELWRDEGIERASEIDRRRDSGETLGPLAGVPTALKDNLSLAGHELNCGSKILSGYRAPYTAGAVERLLAADAVPVGRVNMDEFAMGSSCENSALAVTRNPWNLDMAPGGSSGGSAAAVAAAEVPLALGSDTGGSIRQPAAFCGVVGVKPTYGRVSRYGLVAFASSLDQIGPLTRTVRDAALALGSIAGPDARDSTCSDLPVENYLESIEDGIEGLKVGTIREVRTSALDEDAAEGYGWALRALEAAGAELIEVSVPLIEAAVATYYVLANSEASANLARFDGSRYGHRATGARSLQRMYTDSRSEGFGSEVKRRIILGTFALSSGYYDAYYGRAAHIAEAMRQQFASAFDAVDLLVTPTCPSGAFARGERVDDPLSMYLSDVFTTPPSLVGIPGVSVPCGLDSRGLPLGLQILAPPFADAMALRAARAVELAIGFECSPEAIR